MVLACFIFQLLSLLALQIASDIGVVTVIEALLLQNLLDTQCKFLHIKRQFIYVIYMFVKWNHLNNLYKVHIITRWHLGYQLSFRNDY